MMLAAALGDWPRLIGEIALVTAAAVMIGFLILKLWPKSANPQMFAFLIPFVAVALLAYFGSASAAIALGLLGLLAIAAFFLGIA